MLTAKQKSDLKPVLESALSGSVDPAKLQALIQAILALISLFVK